MSDETCYKEICIMCSKETCYNKQEDINSRTCYVEGTGQLCNHCYVNTFFGI